MKTLLAKIIDNKANLEKSADSINNRRIDDTYFYVNGNDVSVSNPYFPLSIEEQISNLEWFLKGRAYEMTIE